MTTYLGCFVYVTTVLFPSPAHALRLRCDGTTQAASHETHAVFATLYGERLLLSYAPRNDAWRPTASTSTCGPASVFYTGCPAGSASCLGTAMWSSKYCSMMRCSGRGWSLPRRMHRSLCNSVQHLHTKCTFDPGLAMYRDCDPSPVGAQCVERFSTRPSVRHCVWCMNTSKFVNKPPVEPNCKLIPVCHSTQPDSSGIDR